MKNYYEILEISANSSEIEIKKAFRKKAFEFHPDKNSSNNASAKFREVYEAYEILIDSNKRCIYDRLYAEFFIKVQPIEIINKDKVYEFEDIVNETGKRAEYFSKMSYQDMESYFRIIFNNIPDLALTSFILILGCFLVIGSLFNENTIAILIGFVIGFPLIIVSLHDFSLIFKLKNRKEKLKELMIID